MSISTSTTSTDISEKAHPVPHSKQLMSGLVLAISKTLSVIVENNKKIGSYNKRLREQRKNVMNAPASPSISLISFLNRIRTYTEIEDSSLINSMVYIDRLCAIAKITLTPLNIHRIIIGSIVISIKYNEDNSFNFDYYSKVFGIAIKELKDIEFNFIQMIKYDLYISQADYSKYEYYLTHFQFKEE